MTPEIESLVGQICFIIFMIIMFLSAGLYVAVSVLKSEINQMEKNLELLLKTKQEEGKTQSEDCVENCENDSNN